MIKVLLIDDELLEKDRIEYDLTQACGLEAVELEHVYKCSEAIKLLIHTQYDFILLDNTLAASISGQFSVPIIQQYIGTAKLVMISNDINVEYLSDKSILGVDDIIDKANLEAFFSQWASIPQTNSCENPVRAALN